MIVAKTPVDRTGKITIPVKMRRQLRIKAGDEITIECIDNKLTLYTVHSSLAKAWNILDKYKDKDLSGELNLMRQEDAAREQ